MSLSAPVVPAERLLALSNYQSKTLWSPTARDEHSGLGAAFVLAANGETRFEQIRDGAERLFRNLVSIALDGPPAPDPQLVGAFAFQPARVTSALWRDFGDARFVLPRIAYTRRAERAWLTISVNGHELSSVDHRSRLAAEVHAALASLQRPLRVKSPGPVSMVMTDEAAMGWRELVTGICGEIDAGRLEKAVAARHIVLRGALLPHPAHVLEKLRVEAPGCTRFALAAGERTFLGASPERLVKRTDFSVWTEALAGSTPGKDPTHSASLLLNRKDCGEHAIVAREIRAVMAQICESVVETRPEVHQLRHVAHLRTRFEGHLREPRHVLDLVAQIHPTSAVGGAPRSAALAWLSEHEHADRGLYAGPFGAFDCRGNGEFAVAIRSGLLAVDEAHLFAGAGIVDGSQVRTELRETRWKLRSFLAALGSG